jgi:hypothetical protein
MKNKDTKLQINELMEKNTFYARRATSIGMFCAIIFLVLNNLYSYLNVSDIFMVYFSVSIFVFTFGYAIYAFIGNLSRLKKIKKLKS